MVDIREAVANFREALARATAQPPRKDPATRLAEGLGISRAAAKDYLFPHIYGAQGLSGKALDKHVDDILARAKEEQ